MNSFALANSKSPFWYLNIRGQPKVSTLRYPFFKGKLNHRLYSDVPITNNFKELELKQLKHFLSRTIGYRAKKYYFLALGDHYLYVNPKES